MTESEIFNFAIKNYHNPVCKTAEEFTSDYNTVVKIRKLIGKHLLGEELNCRLLLNHFMTFYNVFVPASATVILFLRLPKEQHSIVKTVATFLQYVPDNLEKYNIEIDKIEFDHQLIEFFRRI